MKLATTIPLGLAFALVGGCSDDPAPVNDGIGTPMGATATGDSGSTTGAGTLSTSGAGTGTSGGVSTSSQTVSSSAGGATGTSVGTGFAGTGVTGATMTTTTASDVSGIGGGSAVGVGGSSTGGGGASTAATSIGDATSTTGNTTLPTGSSGCGMQASQATGEWVSQAGARQWAIYLPDNYDPNRPYPLVVQLHGCTSGTNNVPVERESGEDAIHVRGTGSGGNTCWDTNADVEFFDSMVDGVKAATCVDENRIFAAGYSSGSWLISVLACTRGEVLRAAGTVAGGNALPGNATCTGTIAQIFIHDLDDEENDWDSGGGNNHIHAMERLVDVNGCTPDDPVPEEPAPCVRYQDCGENPIKHCPTTGRGHNRQDSFAAAAFWEFFSEF